jgi:hypothetical protein
MQSKGTDKCRKTKINKNATETKEKWSKRHSYVWVLPGTYEKNKLIQL